MRKETSLVRPFFKMQQDLLQGFVNQIGIRLGSDEDFSAAESIKTDLKIEDARPVLAIPDHTALDLSPLNAQDFQSVVTLRDDSRRRAGVLVSTPLPEVGRELPLSLQHLGIDYCGPKGGQLSVYLALPNERLAEVGLPWFSGHFVACKHFSINRSGPGKEFPVEFKSTQELEQLGYATDTMLVVHGSPDDLHVTDIEDANLTILVNDRLRAAIRAAKNSPRGRLVRGTLYYAGLAQLVEILKLAEASDPLPAGSIGSTLQKSLARVSKSGKFDWASIDSGEIARLHSVAQARADVLQLAEDAR